jgi:hypothetical protein
MRFDGYGAVKTCCHVRLPPRPAEYGTAISRHDLPEAWPWFSPKRGSRECRMRAAPAVSRAMGRRKRTRAYRFSGGNPAFPAQWLYGLYALFPATNSCCHRRQRIEICLSPVGPTRLRRLDISHGCQNHTTSPYAAPSPVTPIGEMPPEAEGEGLETPVVCTTLDHSRENPPCDHDRARRRCVHRIQPRVRDDRDTPLLPGWTGEVIAVIWPEAKAEYFYG